jgi:phospholipid/cholesterol/gamma-HCH transport system substrate-binding protein
MGTSVLIGLIFLMSGATGGLFSKRLLLRSYFDNAAGLKVGAPVTLEGVTIGNVARIRVVPSRNPNPVEVTMRVGREYLRGLHTDSTASIAQAGVLGDSYVDLNSTTATGPPPGENAELKASGSPSIQDVIRTSEQSIIEIQNLTRKLEVTVDAINSRKGLAGEVISGPALAGKINRIATNLEAITNNISEGKGSLGKLLTDDTLYTRASSAVDKLDKIATALNEGQGTAGKLLHDDTLYNNLNATVANTNQLVAEINAGHGALGKLAKDPAFARKMDDTVTHLDAILTDVSEGKGTLGQLAQNRALYDHANQMTLDAQQLLTNIRDNPKKYLVIRLKLF